MSKVDPDRAYINRALEVMTAATVRDWLSERQANCLRHASTRSGSDREGWLLDYAFFSAAIGMIDWSALERDAAQLTTGAKQ